MVPCLLSRPVPHGAVASVDQEGPSQLVPLQQGLPASGPHLLMCVSLHTSAGRPPPRCLPEPRYTHAHRGTRLGKEAETTHIPHPSPSPHPLKTEPQRALCKHPSLVRRTLQTPRSRIPHRVKGAVVMKHGQSGNQYLGEVLSGPVKHH